MHADLDAFNGDLNAAVEMYMQSNGNSSGGAAGPSTQSVIGAGFASMYNEQFGLLHPQVILEFMFEVNLIMLLCSSV